MSRIALIGGHGKVALLTIPLLVADGHEVTAIIRNPDHTAEVEELGAAALVADVEQLTTDELVEVLRGHESVIWSAGAGGGNPSRTFAVDRDAAIRSMDAAVAAAVRRYVMVSYAGAGPDHGIPEDDGFYAYAEAKAAADAHLRRSALDWTVLGPSRLTSGDPTGRIEVIGDGVAKGEVSRANVAATIRCVLSAPGLAVHRTVEFNDGDTPVPEVFGA